MSIELFKTEGTGNIKPFIQSNIWADPKHYKPSEGLKDAINVALTLGQPLLLTGEPGTGKTEFASHLSYFFGLDSPLVFHSQTTSTGKDLFYQYDALGHFQFSQNSSNSPLSADEVTNKFIRFGALGEAILSNKTRRVVLIDEIDKAPRDFPNDILYAIEKLTFKVSETGKEYKTLDENRPIVIITSNSEKNLPDAFLRRVTYYHIEFPTQEQLIKILSNKVFGIKTEECTIIISEFDKIRKNLVNKKPATAELLYWADLLKKISFNLTALKDVTKLTENEKKKLAATFCVLAKNKDDLAKLKELYKINSNDR